MSVSWMWVIYWWVVVVQWWPSPVIDCSKGPPAVECNLDVAALWMPLKCKEGRNKHDSKPFVKIGMVSGQYSCESLSWNSITHLSVVRKMRLCAVRTIMKFYWTVTIISRSKTNEIGTSLTSEPRVGVCRGARSIQWLCSDTVLQ